MVRRNPAGRAVTLALVPAVLLLSACASSGSLTTSPGAGPSVVASTDVYGDIAAAVAGGHARITALINDPTQDPHEFEASGRDQLAVARADILVENGGGYDDFMGRMRAAAGRKDVTVIDVVALSGRRPVDGDLNEHVWYDLPTAARYAIRLAGALAAKDPADRATYESNAERFAGRVLALEKQERAIRARYAGTGVAITEPLPLYLLQACGLVDRTPSAFSAAIEAGNGVSATLLARTLQLFSTHAVRALVYNAQTSGADTTRMLAAAHAHGIPAVPVTETLPAGLHFLSWMQQNLTAIRSALQS